MKSHKQSASEFARSMSQYGFMLDFSLISLEEEIDKIMESGPHENQAGLEAYVGETLARLFDGAQKGEFDDDNPAANFYLCYIEFGAYKHFPSHFIGYRLSNGPGEGSYKDYLKKELPKIKARKDIS